MKKPLTIILMVIIACLILIWVASLIKCEVLTHKYGEEFKTLYKQANMLGEQKYHKVLDYSDASARVYYVSANRAGGNVLMFVKKNGNWELEKWDTVWSKSGSADGFVWPYVR